MDEKATVRKSSCANDHQIELVDFTDLMTLLFAEIQDWLGDHILSAKDLADILCGTDDLGACRAQVAK